MEIKGKKGQILDIIFVTLMIFMFSIVALIMYKVVFDTNTQMQDEDTISSEGKDIIQGYTSHQPSFIQNLIMMVLVGSSIAMVVSAFLIMSHPIFYPLMIIVLAFTTWLNSIYANAYQDIASSEEFIGLAVNMPILEQLMHYFPLVMFVISLIIVIVMVGKGQ